MKAELIGKNVVHLKPTDNKGKIKDKVTNSLYSEVFTKLAYISRYEDSDPVEYEETEIAVDSLPEDVQQAFSSVFNLIFSTVQKYDAVQEFAALENINISSLFALADAKHVSEEDMTNIIRQVVLLKTDIEAKLPKSWYSIWNYYLKVYIAQAIEELKKSSN